MSAEVLTRATDLAAAHDDRAIGADDVMRVAGDNACNPQLEVCES